MLGSVQYTIYINVFESLKSNASAVAATLYFPQLLLFAIELLSMVHQCQFFEHLYTPSWFPITYQRIQVKRNVS